MDARTVAIPAEDDSGLEAERSAHFGRAPFFVIARVEDGEVVESHAALNPPRDEVGHGYVAMMLAAAGVTDIITASIGPGMRTRLEMTGVRLWHDADSATAVRAIERLFAGELLPIADGDVHGHRSSDR